MSHAPGVWGGGARDESRGEREYVSSRVAEYIHMHMQSMHRKGKCEGAGEGEVEVEVEREMEDRYLCI